MVPGRLREATTRARHADDVRTASGLRQCRESDTRRVRGRAYDGGRPDGCLFLETSPACRSVQMDLQLFVVISDLTGVTGRARVRPWPSTYS